MEPTTPRTLSVLDLTREQPNPPAFDPPHHKILRGKTRRDDRVALRDPFSVDGIVVHQTGAPYGVTAAAVKAAKGDRALAKHRRALGVAAHMTAFDTGVAVLAHPLPWYVYHANSLNARSLGLEIEGLFPQNWGAKDFFSDKLEAAARDALTYLVLQGRMLGMPIQYVWAHRQSSLTRDDDPGEEIWRKLVLGFAVPELGLLTLPESVHGGRALPPAWRQPYATALSDPYKGVAP